jgi:excisionase family DNA binding protein
LGRFGQSFAAPVLHDARGSRVVGGEQDRLLTVRQVAARLEVSTATVYALIARGELAHLRVSNAIRVARLDLAAYVTAARRKLRSKTSTRPASVRGTPRKPGSSGYAAHTTARGRA